ncbi:Uncharacterized protein Rs2_00026 [Raphanus sativus]|nr:Uncharacterized protein Rs2_00026 [Raphanus sativus]
MNGLYSVKTTESEERLVKQAREIDEATTRSRELEACKNTQSLVSKGNGGTQNQRCRRPIFLGERATSRYKTTSSRSRFKNFKVSKAEKETAARQTEEAAKRFEVRDIEAKDMLAKLKPKKTCSRT